MGMEMKLQFKMSQQLVMTPQLVQAIRLLQLSRLELIDEIRKELDGNPVLADEETDPRARERNGDAKVPELMNGAVGSDVAEGTSERMGALDMEKRAEDKKVQEIDWE